MALFQPQLRQMAKLAPAVEVDAPASSAQIVVRGVTIAFPLGEIIDVQAERTRLDNSASAAENNATASRNGLPTPTSLSGPNPKRWRRLGRITRRRPRKRNGCVRRWSGWGSGCSPAEAGAQAAAEQRFPLPWTPAFAGEQ